MQIDLTRDSLIEANALFWGQMLSMTLEPMMEAGDFRPAPGDLLGIVRFAGAFCGYVEVTMAAGLANFATAAMLMQPLATVTEIDALDAINEIANMIAGTLKSSLPQPCLMTLPQAMVRREGLCISAHEAGLLTAGFHNPEGNMMIRVCGQHSERRGFPQTACEAIDIEPASNYLHF